MSEKEIVLTITGMISNEETKLIFQAIQFLKEELEGLDFQISNRMLQNFKR